MIQCYGRKISNNAIILKNTKKKSTTKKYDKYIQEKIEKSISFFSAIIQIVNKS